MFGFLEESSEMALIADGRELLLPPRIFHTTEHDEEELMRNLPRAVSEADGVENCRFEEVCENQN